MEISKPLFRSKQIGLVETSLLDGSIPKEKGNCWRKTDYIYVLGPIVFSLALVCLNPCPSTGVEWFGSHGSLMNSYCKEYNSPW